MIKVIFLFFIFSAFAFADDCDLTPKLPINEVGNTMCMFSKPLVLGASVSAGYGTSKGGSATILSRLMNPSARVSNHAISGFTSVQSTSSITTLGYPIPSAVLAFDLFFWDAVKGECGAGFEANTRRLFKLYQDRKIPMVVGKIPMDAPFPAGLRLVRTRPCAGAINTLLEELCTPDKNCLIYNSTDCIRAMGQPVAPDGTSYFVDMIHTSDAGNEVCARQFVSAAKYKKLKCSP